MRYVPNRETLVVLLESPKTIARMRNAIIATVPRMPVITPAVAAPRLVIGTDARSLERRATSPRMIAAGPVSNANPHQPMVNDTIPKTSEAVAFPSDRGIVGPW